MGRTRFLLLLALSCQFVLLTLGCAGSSGDAETQASDDRVASGLLVRYDFDEGSGSIVRDTSGAGTPLDLTAQGSTQLVWDDGSLRLNSSGLLASAVAATKVSSAIRTSGALTVEAWILTLPNSPAGGRALSLSPSIWARNFTLQTSATRAYEFPLRSTATSNQGQPALVTAANAATGSLQHVIFTREITGATRVFVDGSLVASGTTSGTLSNWDTSFRFLLGNEPQADRPWLGEYHLVALYSRALSAAEVAQNFAAGPDGYGGVPPANVPPTANIVPSQSGGQPPLTVSFDAGGSTDQDGSIVAHEWDFGDGATATGSQVSHTFTAVGDYVVRLRVRDDEGAIDEVTTLIRVGAAGTRVTQGLTALYAFEETSGSIVHDTSGAGTPLDLTIQTSGATSWGGGALRTNSSAVIRSAGAATKIISAVKAANALTVEGWLRPTNVQQSRARMISVSPSIWARNFTLGQATLANASPPNTLARFEALMRTTTTGAQGGGTGILSPVASLATRLEHVVYTRDDGGTGRLFIDGAEIATLATGGSTSFWDNGFPLVLANEPTGDRPWLGEFHLVAFYGRALSASEVDQNFRAGASGQGGGTPPTNQPPMASFIRSPASGNAPLAVTFDARASSDPDGFIASHAWNFGDGQTANGATASHTYASAGTFVVTLTVTDDDGATDVATQTVAVQSGGGTPGDVTFTRLVVDADPPLQAHAKGLGDITGDGFLDAVVAGAGNGDGGLFWYEYPAFTKHTIVPEGPVGFTTDMKFADVDKDGDSDIVIPHGIDVGTSVYWYENPRPAGNPRTATWTEHFIGNAGSHDVNVSDLDGDGNIDVIVRDGSLTAFFQNGPNSWTSRMLSTTPREGSDVGDVDSDGDSDILINGVWLENPRPSGNARTTAWTAHQFAASAPQDCSVRLARVNADARPDIVMTSSEGSFDLSWYEAPPDPTSGPWTKRLIQQTTSYNHRIQAGDIDLDGDMDLVTAQMHQSTTDEVVFWENTGAGSSWVKRIISTTGTHNQELADYDRDGDLDIFGVNWHGQTPVELFRNDLEPGDGEGLPGIGSWRRHVIETQKPWRSIFIEPADVNRDGLADIVAGGWWYQNPGSPSGSWTRRTIGSPLNNMAAVYDFDGDGDLDVFGTEGMGSAANHELAWAQNNGSGTFTVRINLQSPTVGAFLQGTTVTRFVPGGPLQVVLSWEGSLGGLQAVTVPSNPTSGTWLHSMLSPVSGGEGVDAADIDRDGDTDLLMDHRYLRNDGASWTPVAFRAVPSDGSDRNFWLDLDGDGDLDALTGYESGATANLAWYEQLANPATPWLEHVIAVLTGPQSVDYADMDADGDLDVVAGEHLASGANSSLKVSVYENLGNAATWRTHLVYSGDEHHDGTKLVDIDNDCDLDIVSQGWTHSQVYVYENLFVTGTRQCAQ